MNVGTDGVAVMEPKPQKTSPVRLTEEAMRWARIASGYTGESMVEYVSRIVAERGKADVNQLHAETVTSGGKVPVRKKGGAK